MVTILKIRLQTSLHRPLCANGDYLNFEQIYSLQLETLGAFKIVIFKSHYKPEIELIESEIVRLQTSL